MTIKQAKAKLNELVEAAEAGETVVLMRGSAHVATIVPITADDLELRSPLGDEQAARLWRTLAAEANAGNVTAYDSAAAALDALGKPAKRRSGSRRSRPRRKAP